MPPAPGWISIIAFNPSNSPVNKICNSKSLDCLFNSSSEFSICSKNDSSSNSSSSDKDNKSSKNQDTQKQKAQKSNKSPSELLDEMLDLAKKEDFEKNKEKLEENSNIIKGWISDIEKCIETI